MLVAFVFSPSAEGGKAKPTRRRPGAAAPATLEARLAALVRRPPIRDRREFAVAVARVGDPQPLLLVNGEKPLILASTTKLFTTAAALDRLGPDYRFRTRLFRDGPEEPDGTLAGHLVVAGGGDPAISGRLYDDDPMAVFRPWARSLAARGIRKVRDGLLLDVSFFDDVRTHPDWPAQQEQFWWQAPVSALSYNDNVVLVRATGGLRPGAHALLGFYPAAPALMTLLGRVVTASGYGARVGVKREAGSPTVLAVGRVGRNRTWSGDVTVPNPPLYFGAALTKALQDEGVDAGSSLSVQTDRAASLAEAPSRVLLHTHETPLLPVVSVCNKRSHSHYAEQILKTLGAERRGVGTWPNGAAEVSEFLASLGLDPRSYALSDGSGRSRENRASATAYLDFLIALATRWKHFAVFEPTLAIAGEGEGSLRHRMLGDATRGRVYAKTGNVAGVVTLAGYVHAASGATYAFTILVNGGCSERRGHAWQDRFVTELATFG